MGRYVFKLPDIGEGNSQAEIVCWHVAAGDPIREDDPLLDVTTDKATIEITSPVTGTVVSLHGTAGEMAAVGAEVAVIEIEGEVKAPRKRAEAAAPAPVVERGSGTGVPAGVPAEPESAADTGRDAGATEGQIRHSRESGERSERAAYSRAGGVDPRLRGDDETLVTAPVRPATERPMASPAVRKRARDRGIVLTYVRGTGPGGRILDRDLDAFAAGGGVAPRPAADMSLRDGVEEVKVTGVRRTIAERMAEAKRRIPHFSYVEEVDVTALEELRAHLNATRKEGRPKLTILPFLIRAMVKALPAFPQINARYDDEAGVVQRHRAVHMGIAAQTPGGLTVPVLRHAEARDVWDCATEIARLSTAARDGKLGREELVGSTITITSLGPLGGIASTPVINRPEVAIVGVNRIVERPVVLGGQIAIRKMMNLSSSFDHRVVDGWDAASFIQQLKVSLEQPATLFMED